MVLGMLCNDIKKKIVIIVIKYAKENCLSYFGINVSKKLVAPSIFFSVKEPAEIFGKMSSF